MKKSVNDGEYTNGNVIVSIIANREIREVEGFILDETKTILTKEVTENEEKEIEIFDYNNNSVKVKFNVSNIDREAPQINGVVDRKNI